VTSLTEEKKPGRSHFFTLFFKCMFTKNNFLMLCCRPTAIHFTF
jgi:hypothetical protein